MDLVIKIESNEESDNKLISWCYLKIKTKIIINIINIIVILFFT